MSDVQQAKPRQSMTPLSTLDIGDNSGHMVTIMFQHVRGIVRHPDSKFTIMLQDQHTVTLAEMDITDAEGKVIGRMDSGSVSALWKQWLQSLESQVQRQHALRQILQPGATGQ